MLIIDENSVYEIDEECMRRKKTPEGCRTYEKIMQREQEKNSGRSAARDEMLFHKKGRE